ncbi:MmgE/PrpD family protein [Pseudogemmobacter bohemicus]|uniref:MmgE/PrpD family protein n=1 Tax=Pseudogemmobacter bohemicus TaxID=2250708 RepID=UPI000DD49E43|nr:MmgE/PrpD family protein [Pseudogemmobacter bohemicus]
MAEDLVPFSSSDVTGRIAAFAASAGPGDIPEPVREIWRQHIADTLACAAAGAALPIAAELRRFALAHGNPGAGAPVIGSNATTSPMLAALSNAFAANALDFDDGFERDGKGMGHPGASLVAAALAALGDSPVTGEAFLAAIIIGAEVNNRLILSVQPSAERFHEVYGIGQHQSVGAAITYARLRGLPAEEMENAIGLAASLTAIPSLHKYNWSHRPIITLKDFVAPAAQAGVQGVELALHGVHGPQRVFDGPQGYWRMVGSDRFDPVQMTATLGTEWLAAEGAFKTYPACRWIAPALEAFEIAWRKSVREPARIERIIIHSFADVGAKMGHFPPANAIDAQFSLPHLLGCIATGRTAGAPWFDDQALSDEKIRHFVSLLSFETDPAMDAAMKGSLRRPSARVEICQTDGRRISAMVECPLGGSRRPLPPGAIWQKVGLLLDQAGLDLSGELEAALRRPETETDLRKALSALFRDYRSRRANASARS